MTGVTPPPLAPPEVVHQGELDQSEEDKGGTGAHPHVQCLLV